MTPAQISRRDALVVRNDAAVERWPDRSGASFAGEMRAVADALEALANAEGRDRGKQDRIERARTWRFAGNALRDLGADRERDCLQRAADAYRNAQALLDPDDGIELVKLNYCFGRTLLKLSDGTDLEMATTAQARLRTALQLAYEYLPDGVATAREELAVADKVVALLGEAGHLGRRAAIRRADAAVERQTAGALAAGAAADAAVESARAGLSRRVAMDAGAGGV